MKVDGFVVMTQKEKIDHCPVKCGEAVVVYQFPNGEGKPVFAGVVERIVPSQEHAFCWVYVTSRSQTMCVQDVFCRNTVPVAGHLLHQGGLYEAESRA